MGHTATLLERILALSSDPNACWIWRHGIGRNGYARSLCTIDGVYKRRLLHRASYELLVGPIPQTLVLDHLCRNRLCVNPRHLEPVTVKENLLRGKGAPAKNARKTVCKHGHELTPENTYFLKRGRRCKTCSALMCQAYERRRKKRPPRQAPHAEPTLKKPTPLPTIVIASH